MRSRAVLHDARQLAEALSDLQERILTLEAKRPEWPLGSPQVAEAGLVGIKRSQGIQKGINVFLDLDRAWCRKVLDSATELGYSRSEVSKALGVRQVRAFMRASHAQGVRRGGQFADPMAQHRVLYVVVQILVFYEQCVSSGCPPKPPGRKDWLAAERAFGTLLGSMRSGIPLTALAACRGVHGMEEGKMEAIMAALRREARLATKPHTDRHSTCRLACKEFAREVYLWFGGVAPPVLIEKFSLLIGYGSEKVTRTYLKRWITEFDRLFRPGVVPATSGRKRSKSGR